MKFPTYLADLEKGIRDSGDPVRYASFALSVSRIVKQKIEGSFAEVGVWKGETSRFLHMLAPARPIHLFDTFQGFPDADLEGAGTREAKRFRETSLEKVKASFRNLDNVIFHPGRFPDTVRGLEDEQFALVSIDVDLYKPTLAALEFFYPRVVSGGYFFLHDYNSPESDHAIRRALDPFLENRPEKLVEIPDTWGSVVFRKL